MAGIITYLSRQQELGPRVPEEQPQSGKQSVIIF
jgi:hypothetical protein